MSAIVGIYDQNGEQSHREYGLTLLEPFTIFPSNSRGDWFNNSVYLGCHAQWITPESINEPLPYHDTQRKLTITADAIIDNRQELLERLQINSHEGKEIPDSKLILLAYAKWGEEVPKHLIGDFAFMLWDENKHQLFGARDFSGARTLYYNVTNKIFSFSTLIDPLLRLRYIEKRVNEEWLAEYLAIPGIIEAVDMHATPYKSIMQLPPSHSITVTKKGVSLNRYIIIEPEEIRYKMDEEYEEAFREVFQRAVSDRLRTHGQVGSHLSGGLDSGTVVSFAAKELKENNKILHTYSSIPADSFEDFTEYGYLADERPFINETVNHVGNIKESYLSFSERDPLSEVDDFLSIMEMPYKFFENTYWLKGINEEASKEGIKVLLNGARGNHSISWGSYKLTYEYYISLLWKLRWVKFYQEIDSYCKYHRTGKKVVLPFITRKAFQTVFSKSNNEYEFRSFISDSLAQKTNVYAKLKEHGVDTNGNTVSDLNAYRNQYYQLLYAWNKSGTAETKLSLRYGLWNRDPTNDLRVIRFCLGIPKEQYVNQGMERSLIRRSTKQLLPDKVRLNSNIRGIQGADTIHRMKGKWNVFINELKQVTSDPIMLELVNRQVIKKAIENMEEIRPAAVFENDFKILTRTLIVHRFIKNFT